MDIQMNDENLIKEENKDLSLESMIEWIISDGQIGSLAEAGGGCVNVCNK